MCTSTIVIPECSSNSFIPQSPPYDGTGCIGTPPKTTAIVVSFHQPSTELQKMTSSLDVAERILTGVNRPPADLARAQEEPPIYQADVQPADLTKLQVVLQSAVEWVEKNDRQVVVCFDGFSTLLQYVESETVYQFFHLMLGRLRQQGHAVHAHLDSSAVSEQQTAQLLTLFNSRVSEPAAVPATHT